MFEERLTEVVDSHWGVTRRAVESGVCVCVCVCVLGGAAYTDLPGLNQLGDITEKGMWRAVARAH
jgi:hypothetical protein